MKNFIIYNDFAFPYGGTGKVAFDSAIALANRGYNVTFFSGTGPESNLLEENGIQSVCLHQPDMLSDKNKLKAAIRSIWNQKAYKKTLQLLKRYNKQDTIIVVHGYAKTLSTSIFSAFKKTDFKVAVILHDYFAVCPNGGFYIYPKHMNCHFAPLTWSCLTCNCDVRSYRQKLYRYVRQLFIRYNLKGNKDNLLAFYVSDLSGSLMSPYLKDYFYKYETLLNPVDVYNGEYINISKNNKYIYIGRLSQEKGIRDFCSVITELKLDGMVIGDGYLLDNLKKEYADIEFVGWANKEEKFRYASHAKCLIFPSLVHETYGLAVPEMLSMGIPCIMPQGCGATNLIKDGVNGYTYPMGDYNALKHCVEVFEKTDLKKIQESTRNSFCRKDFSIDSYISSFISKLN